MPGHVIVPDEEFNSHNIRRTLLLASAASVAAFAAAPAVASVHPDPGSIVEHSKSQVKPHFARPMPGHIVESSKRVIV